MDRTEIELMIAFHRPFAEAGDRLVVLELDDRLAGPQRFLLFGYGDTRSVTTFIPLGTDGVARRGRRSHGATVSGPLVVRCRTVRQLPHGAACTSWPAVRR
ncbi:hypothetical protein ACFY3N_19820 [Streptomyces sp. NPDC000348]|uniref:hypothetical protein n=1 Tax=Streptomyces sp. NPDC000348 TaxID=3364538 RepID=UPI0036BA87B4